MFWKHRGEKWPAQEASGRGLQARLASVSRWGEVCEGTVLWTHGPAGAAGGWRASLGSVWWDRGS